MAKATKCRCRRVRIKTGPRRGKLTTVCQKRKANGAKVFCKKPRTVKRRRRRY